MCQLKVLMYETEKLFFLIKFFIEGQLKNLPEIRVNHLKVRQNVANKMTIFWFNSTPLCLKGFLTKTGSFLSSLF